MAHTKDVVTGALFLYSLVWGCRLIWQLHETVRERQAKHPDTYPRYSDLQRSAVTCACLLISQKVFTAFSIPVARMIIPKKARWSQFVWGAKVHRASDSLFKCVYYLAMTLWAWYVLHDKPWVPWVLGGSGETQFCWTDWSSFQTTPADLKHFYLTAIGYHLSEVVMHMVNDGCPDFWEMLLHHTVACFLVCYSYLLSYVPIGCLALLLHGSTDVFVYMSKCLVDTPYVSLTAVSYFALVLSHAWFRIYVFPMYVIKSAWVESIQVVGGELPAWGFLNFSLCVLLLLHMYWFILIIKMGIGFKRTGEARDIASNLSKLAMKDERRKAWLSQGPLPPQGLKAQAFA